MDSEPRDAAPADDLPLPTGRHDDREFVERCKYIPMRLNEHERQLLELLLAALNVSEYTDSVDTLSRRNKGARIVRGIKDMCAIQSGLMVCTDLRKGEQLLERPLEANEAFFQTVFEVGRRYKVLNPEKMRANYGKLMYLLQDAANAHTTASLGFSCHAPLKMVSVALARARGADALLWDARVLPATADVAPPSARRSAARVAAEVRLKRACADALVAEYAAAAPAAASANPAARAAAARDDPAAPLTADDVRRVLDSIADANHYLRANVEPVEQMLSNLLEHFDPSGPSKDGPSLALSGGGGIARRFSSGFDVRQRAACARSVSRFGPFSRVFATFARSVRACSRAAVSVPL